MRVVVDVVCAGAERPPSGSPVIVQVRDTSIADAPSRLIGEAVGLVGPSTGGRHVATVSLTIAAAPSGATVRAHVDVDGDGRVTTGDFVSTASHPLPPGAPAAVRLEVPVRLV